MYSASRLNPRDLDELALAAYAAVVHDGVERSQVNKLIELLDDLKNVDYLLAYIARQVGRGVWGKKGRKKNVKRYFSALKLYSLLKGKDIDSAREILGVFKWLYEAGEKKSEQLVVLRSKVQNLTAKAPTNFFYDYLSATLR